jgi:hypothetical protein
LRKITDFSPHSTEAAGADRPLLHKGERMKKRRERKRDVCEICLLADFVSRILYVRSGVVFRFGWF